MELVSYIVDAYQQHPNSYPDGEFDKDDDLAWRFVAAASNLRNGRQCWYTRCANTDLVYHLKYQTGRRAGFIWWY